MTILDVKRIAEEVGYEGIIDDDFMIDLAPLTEEVVREGGVTRI